MNSYLYLYALYGDRDVSMTILSFASPLHDLPATSFSLDSADRCLMKKGFRNPISGSYRSQRQGACMNVMDKRKWKGPKPLLKV